MADSETFGVEKGHGNEVIGWLNDTARRGGLKFEAREYGHSVDTENFGSFELFSWVGDVRQARRLIIRAGRRFKIRTVEGGYRTKERIFALKRSDYAMVRRGDRVIGHLQFESPRFGRGHWAVVAEERR